MFCVRRQQQHGDNYYSDTLKQRNRFTATLSQNMDDYGTLSLSGSSTDYYNNRSRITELQLSYNNMWKTQLQHQRRQAAFQLE
jgi:outer membrane usher protein